MLASAEKYSELIKHAHAAKEKAVAPYSNFPVGAALETKTGRIYWGCNIESSSFGLTLCAERVAIFKALSEGEKEFTALAVVADTDDFCPPCGACRQIIIDFAPDSNIVLLNKHGDVKEMSIRELLPHAFTQSNLKDS